MSGLNEVRGEAGLVIDGQVRRLCLTMGALAQIESALETTSLDELSARLLHLSAADVLAVLGALLMGGGNPLTRQELMSASIDPAATATAIAETFSLAMQDI